jgi:hypothetical protein
MLLLLVHEVSWWYSYHTRCFYRQLYGFIYRWFGYAVLRGTLKPSLVFYISYHHNDPCSDR